MLTKEQIEAIADKVEKHETEAVVTCPRCGSKGYHHGFGEHGHDPDWCVDCVGISEWIYQIDPDEAAVDMRSLLQHIEALDRYGIMLEKLLLRAYNLMRSSTDCYSDCCATCPATNGTDGVERCPDRLLFKVIETLELERKVAEYQETTTA